MTNLAKFEHSCLWTLIKNLGETEHSSQKYLKMTNFFMFKHSSVPTLITKKKKKKKEEKSIVQTTEEDILTTFVKSNPRPSLSKN